MILRSYRPFEFLFFFHHKFITDSTKSKVLLLFDRQLEAIIRISESLAKMQLQPFATDVHVNEALRLFQVSTLDAAMSGSLAGAEGFTTEEDHEMLNRIEKQLKRRFAIGSQVSEQNIIAVSVLTYCKPTVHLFMELINFRILQDKSIQNELC